MSAKTVLKYVLKYVLRPDNGVAEVNVPQTSKVVEVGYDPNNLLAVWIEQPVVTEPTGGVQPATVEMITRRFHVLETGSNIPEGAARYIGTAIAQGQQKVWHLYEER